MYWTIRLSKRILVLRSLKLGDYSKRDLLELYHKEEHYLNSAAPSWCGSKKGTTIPPAKWLLVTNQGTLKFYSL